MKNKRKKQTNFVYIYKVSKFFAKKLKKICTFNFL